MVVPDFVIIDPLRALSTSPLLGAPAHLLAMFGGILAWAGQVGMGTSWRVGVEEGALGELATEGLYRAITQPGLRRTAPVPHWRGDGGARGADGACCDPLLVFGARAVYRAYRTRVPHWVGWERGGSMRHRRPRTSS